MINDEDKTFYRKVYRKKYKDFKPLTPPSKIIKNNIIEPNDVNSSLIIQNLKENYPEKLLLGVDKHTLELFSNLEERVNDNLNKCNIKLNSLVNNYNYWFCGMFIIILFIILYIKV